jgi:hypothetical protein
MISCPFCGHANEDGTLYCDKCKTDLSIPAPSLSELPSESAPPEISLEMISPPVISEDLELPETKRIDQIPMVESLSKEPETAAPTVEPTPVVQEVEPLPVTPVPVSPAIAETSTTAPTVPAPKQNVVPPALKPKLVVIRGEKIDMEYPVYPGKNYIGRTDDKPVDIDLENQEPADRIWSSRQHAIITFENGVLTIEDLNSLNGTFVNRTRVHPGQNRTLHSDDIVQIGTVQMRVVLTSSA